MTTPQQRLPHATTGETAPKPTSTPAKLLRLSGATFAVAVPAFFVGRFVGGGVIYGIYMSTLFIIVASVLLAATLVSATTGKRTNTRPAAVPIAYTDGGEPIYPVVGYTSNGEPVTADRVAALSPTSANPRTNSNAVVALVLGVLLGPLAIPFGHIARGQIRRTGEQGAGIALAGLILGYASLTLLVIGALTIAITFA